MTGGSAEDSGWDGATGIGWNVYEIGPIDYGWQQLRTVRETLAVFVVPDEGSDPREGLDTSASLAFLRSWESAKDAATAAGWEGEFRLEPRVFWLPCNLQMSHGFVFKQAHSGTTFVISPQPLGHLERLAGGG